MQNYEQEIGEQVNDFDKIGHGQQVIDHGPDYEVTQNRALSMDCANQDEFNAPNINPLDEHNNLEDENSFKLNQDQINSVNDHCN